MWIYQMGWSTKWGATKKGQKKSTKCGATKWGSTKLGQIARWSHFSSLKKLLKLLKVNFWKNLMIQIPPPLLSNFIDGLLSWPENMKATWPQPAAAVREVYQKKKKIKKKKKKKKGNDGGAMCTSRVIIPLWRLFISFKMQQKSSTVLFFRQGVQQAFNKTTTLFSQIKANY